MLKKSFVIAAIIITAGYCEGEFPPGPGGDYGTPEPVSTAMIGTALAVLVSRKIRNKD